MLRIGIFFLMVGIPLATSAQERDPWIGKVVLLKPGATVTADGVAVDPRFQSFPTTVLDANDDSVCVRRGWVKKRELMSPDEALTYSDERLKRDPKDAKMWRLRGLAWLGKGDSIKAIYSLDEALGLDPTYSEAFVDRGRVKGGRGDYESAFNDYGTALRLDSKAPVPYARRGQLWLTKGDFKQAGADCNQAIELDPKCDEAFVTRGDAALLQNDRETAIADYSSAIKSNPRNAEAFRNRAICWIKQHSVDRALSDIDDAIRLAPEDSYHFLIRGCCLSLRGDFEKAIESMSESIRLRPNQPAGYVLRGRLYQLLAKDDKAIEDFESAAALDPNNPTFISEIAWTLATSQDEDLRDGKRSIEFANKACELTGWKSHSVIAALAAGYAATGDWDKAIHFQRDSIDKAPREAKKRRQEALELYERREVLHFTTQQQKELLNTSIFNLSPTFIDEHKFQ